jgi:triacylglycerol lipase
MTSLPVFRRRALLGSLLAATAWLAGCATPQGADPQSAPTHPPILFLHGNGDGAAQWQSLLWRFESNGWPRERLFALRHPYPFARSNDSVEQAGRTSTAEHMAFLQQEVERVRKATGAQKVVLVANSRGGLAVRNYIQNGGGAEAVSHAILGGTPNHGVHAIPGFYNETEFSGLSPFMQQLNQPKNAAGDEVIGPVRWLTLRSDHNDRYAQPDGRWLGRAGQPTNVGYDGPALKGAVNVVLRGADHREVSFSAAAFAQTYRFITGAAPKTTAVVPEARVAVGGVVTGLGLDPLDARSGNTPNNLPLTGARVEVHAVNAATGAREGAPVLQQTVAADGRWGPVPVAPGQPLELVVSAPGYATTHYYRSGFVRSSDIVDLRGTRLAVADAHAPSVVILWRPRGYLDPGRAMLLDGKLPPNVPAGASTSWSKIQVPGEQRTVVAEFDGERVVGQSWPAKDGHMVYLELSY